MPRAQGGDPWGPTISALSAEATEAFTRLSHVGFAQKSKMRAWRQISRARLLSSRAASPLVVLGLQSGATKNEVKSKFYTLAKQVHPDVKAGGAAETDAFTFVEVLAAYEALIAEIEFEGSREAGSTTAPNKAARGGSVHSRRQSTAKQPPHARTEWTVGEIMCEQLLDDDCSAQTLATVWMDVKSFYRRASRPASEFMVDALFSACARTGGGFDGALEMLRDGKECGAMSGAAQISAVCALMKWCGEDARVSFEFVVNEVDEWERTPEALDRLHSAYYLRFGVDPLCSWR
jgi:hypothetical protein